MITLGLIISESGLSPKDFSRLSKIPVKLYDRKNRELTKEEDFNFGKKLFAKNLDSKKRFGEFLEDLSKTKFINEILGHLGDDVLILRIQGCTPEFFWL